MHSTRKYFRWLVNLRIGMKVIDDLHFLFIQLWRVSESEFQFRTSQGQFLTCDGEGCVVSATAKSPSTPETFEIERNNDSRVHIKLKSGTYLQVCTFPTTELFSSRDLGSNYFYAYTRFWITRCEYQS